jgi:Icc-related predicted phosphoesterase
LTQKRYLDIFISHAPPWGIHDQPDLPHQGIKAFRWLIETFQPRYHFHGHIHVYRKDQQTATQLGRTTVLNTYGYLETQVDLFEANQPDPDLKLDQEEGRN